MKLLSIAKNKIGIVILILVVVFVQPMFAATVANPCVATPSNAPTTAPSNLTEVICLAVGFLGSIVPTIIGLALVAFLWGLAQFILASGDEKKVQEGKDLMFWGIIGLFVMLSIYTIVSILFSDFLGTSATFGVPLLDTTP